MIIEMIDKDFLEKEIIFKLSKEKISFSKEKKIDELSKSLDLKGFRKGFIPRSVIVSRFSEEINSEVLNQLLYKGLVDFLKKNDIVCVKFPVLKTADYTSFDEYALFVFSFEVYPVIDINFDKIKVSKYKSFISDSDIDSEIERLRKAYGTWDVAEFVSVGDNIAFDIVNKNNVSVFSDNDVLVDDTYKNLIGLVEFIVGKKKGLDYVVSFYNNVVKEGFDIDDDPFVLRINEIKTFNAAALNSDFYNKIGFDARHDFKSFIKLKLNDVMFNIVNDLLKRDVLSSLLSGHDFYVPKSVLDDRFFDFKNKGLDKSRESLFNEIKLELLLKEIIKKFNIRVSKDEILSFSYKHYGSAQVDESLYNYIENEIFIEKVKEVLISKIHVDEKEVMFCDLLNMGRI